MFPLVSGPSVSTMKMTGHASSGSNRRSQVSCRPPIILAPPVPGNIPSAAFRSSSRSVVKSFIGITFPAIENMPTWCCGGSTFKNSVSALRSELMPFACAIASLLSTMTAIFIGVDPGSADSMIIVSPSSWIWKLSAVKSSTGAPAWSVTLAKSCPSRCANAGVTATSAATVATMRDPRRRGIERLEAA